MAVVAELRRRHEKRVSARLKHWQVFDLSDERESADYYIALSRSISEAKNQIYRSGRGFAEIKRAQEKHIADLISAERAALRNEVEITRIQTSRRASPVWAKRYAALMEEFPDDLAVYADYANPPLVNVAVVDPSGPNPTVQLLFEAHEFSSGPRYRAATSIFLYGRSDIATSIHHQFRERIRQLERLTPSDVRNLGASYLYFAYGSNLSRRQMHLRCPGAKLFGPAVLYGWFLRFSVDAPHLGGATAGIERSERPNDRVFGVIWELSSEDKEALDAAERGGYEPRELEVKPRNQRESETVFTYIPVQASPQPILPVESYLDAMIEGAREHELYGLLDDLEELRVGRSPGTAST